MRLETRLRAVLDETLERTAQEYCDDLADHLGRNHRVTGLLADSIGYELAGEGEVVAGSDVPYADYFEAKTGAVAEFTSDWLREGGGEAVKAAKRAANRRLP